MDTAKVEVEQSSSDGYGSDSSFSDAVKKQKKGDFLKG